VPLAIGPTRGTVRNVEETGSEKEPWVERLPEGEPLKDGLARLVDQDHDAAEVAYYEAAADPIFVAVERDQRRYRGMFRRRMRHLRGRRQR